MLPFQSYRVNDLNAHYVGSFSDEEYQWIAVNAKGKARNIARLLGKTATEIDSILEVGCGAGVVLQTLGEMGIGRQLTGVDMEDPAHHQVSGRAPNMRLQKYDGQQLPFEDGSFDLVYATHVLEHVTNERAFISELGRVAKNFIYVEVPCELHIRSSQKAIQNTLDIGHINFYTPDSFFATLETSGLKVLRADIFDHDFDVYKFKKSKPKALLSAAIRKLLMQVDKRIAAKIFCYHCGALCIKS